LPSPFPPSISPGSIRINEKKSKDGRFVLHPQPEDTMNDPLNWPTWRRDIALYSLGFYCMMGGGMTPILAAGFNDVAKTYDVSVPRVALTTGLYMMGMGLGGVIASPTAILYGKCVSLLCMSIAHIALIIRAQEASVPNRQYNLYHHFDMVCAISELSIFGHR
jgi:hypothetical protein